MYVNIFVSTAMKIGTVIFDVVKPCSLVGGYKCFGAMCRLHRQGGTEKTEAVGSSEMVLTVMNPAWCHIPQGQA
jgi:hypothetical protein